MFARHSLWDSFTLSCLKDTIVLPTQNVRAQFSLGFIHSDFFKDTIVLPTQNVRAPFSLGFIQSVRAAYSTGGIQNKPSVSTQATV
jgi:hypothetical protein